MGVKTSFIIRLK